MTVINLSDYNTRREFSGDYVGNLAEEMAAATSGSHQAKRRVASPGKAIQAPAYARVYEAPTPGSPQAPIPVPRHTATVPAQRVGAKGAPVAFTKSVHARMNNWHGQTPLWVTPWQQPITSHAGGGGSQMAFAPASAPLIRGAAVSAEAHQQGWRTVSNYKGFLVQEYRSPLQRPLYRGIWGQETTPPRSNPRDTHQDIDRTAEAPRVSFTRNLPQGQGIPDKVRAQVQTRDIAAWNQLGQKLARLRKEWGATGHVETYHGVRIFRGKRNIQTPDGKKITVPFYYTKQKLKGVNPGATPINGYLAADAMNNNLAMVDGPAEAETLDDIKAIINTHPLKENERPALDEGPGPAAGTIQVEALPGEAGTQPEMTIMSNPENKTKAKAIGVAAAAAALLYFMG